MEEALGSLIHRAVLWAILSATITSAQTLQIDPSKIAEPLSAGQRAPEPASNTPTPTKADAPQIANGYLYVEPYQARFEALIDAKSILHWLNPLKEIPSTLDASTQKSVTTAATKHASEWCQLNVGSLKIAGNFIGASIIKGKPGATLPFEEGAEIATQEAMIGFIWEYPTPPSPNEITLHWQGFIGEIKELPIRVFFGPKSELLQVSQNLPKSTWKAQGRIPRPSPLASVPTLTIPAPLPFPLATALWIIAGLFFYGFIRIRDHHLPGGSMPFFATWLLGAVLSWPLLRIDLSGSAEVPQIKEPAQAEAIVTPLLRNVYRAFDHRTESEIYDVLAMSVDGELLRKLYLETIQALTLDGREGTRVTISEFSADILKVEQTSEGFVTEVQWTALGSVGHWGHAHTRVNRYTAKVTVSPVQTAWKITQLDVSEARRL